MYTIYKYTNTANGKVYIGQTSKSLEDRAQSNGSNYRECRRFYAAIQKYSWESFLPSVLERVETISEANERESYYIELYHSTDSHYGYNIALGGDNKIMSSESKEIISRKAKERYTNKAANPMFGKRHSDETIRKQSAKKQGAKNPMYGTHWNEHQRANSGTRGKRLNLSEAQRQALSERARRLGEMTGLRPVYCIEDALVFSSVTEAARTYGVSKSTLCGHLNGHQKTCRHKHFKYVDSEGATTIEQAQDRSE